MPLPLIAAGAQIAAPIIGGLIGNASAAGDRKRAMDIFQQNVRDLEAIGVPSVEAQQLMLEKYRSEGQLTPELEQEIKLGDSAMGGISLDPAYKEAQMGALNKLKEVGDSGGMTLTDRANMEQTMGDIAATERGRREAALSRMRARGQLGSGLELGAQLGGNQEAVTARHLAGVTAAGAAQDRALQAIVAGGNLGGSMRTQEFSEKAKAAEAADAIAKWNAANQQGIQTRNTGTQNEAQKYNLGNAQSLSNSNVDLANKQQVYNKGLQQQYFDNRMKKGTAINNARTGQANSYNDAADRTAGMWAGIGSGAGKVAGAYLSQDEDDDKTKLSSQIGAYKIGF